MEDTRGHCDKWEVDDAEVDEEDGGYLADKKKAALQPQFGLYIPGRDLPPPPPPSTKRLGPSEDMVKARQSFTCNGYVCLCVPCGCMCVAPASRLLCCIVSWE